MNELSIKIKIGNREYPMKVKAEDEIVLRQAGKRINEKIKSYQEHFGIDDFQDLLAMTAIDCFVEKEKSTEMHHSTDEVALDQISKLNRLISSEL